jgi:thioredoxin-related protein
VIRLLLILGLIPLIGSTQEITHLHDSAGHGIRFEKEFTWEQIKTKAKKENKYIFVDCYASWCGPCKQMDNDVYPNPKVGDYFNSHFISVKIQLDTSGLDDSQEKTMYGVAHEMQNIYHIIAMPTYLLFSPNGKIVHKDLGYKNADDLITLAGNAANPDKQFYTLKEKYLLGLRNYTTMPYLAFAAKRYLEDSFAIIVAQDYLKGYLYKLNEEALYTKDNINLIATFIQSSKEIGFNLFYIHSDRIDHIMWKGYAQHEVDYLITKEQIIPVLDATKNENSPDWNKLSKTITNIYGTDYASRNILDAKVNWYRDRKNWTEYARYALLQVEKSNIDTTDILADAHLNDVVWDVIFLHSNDKKQINTGINWMKGIVRRHPFPNTLDTYANLLYKAGKNEQAIALEEKAVQLNQDPKDKSFQEVLAKMKRGEPTWIQ